MADIVTSFCFVGHRSSVCSALSASAARARSSNTRIASLRDTRRGWRRGRPLAAAARGGRPFLQFEATMTEAEAVHARQRRRRIVAALLYATLLAWIAHKLARYGGYYL